MAFCMNCGKPLCDGDRCCGNCGAPVVGAAQINQVVNNTPVNSFVDVKAQRGAVTPKGGKRMGWIIALAAVVILAVAAVIVLGNPKIMVTRALYNTKNAFAKSDLVSGISAVCNGGSVELTSDLNETFYDMGYDIPLNIGIKTYLDASESDAALVCTANYNGSSLGDIALYSNDDEVALDLDLLFSEPYGVDLNAASVNLPNSIFAPDSTSYYTMSESYYDTFMTALESATSDDKPFENLPDVASAFMTKLATQVSAEGEFEKSSRTVTVGSESVNTTAVTVTLGAAELSRIVKYMNDYVQNDPDVYDLLLDFASSYSVSDPYYYDYYDSLEEIADELLDDLDYEAEDMIADLEYYDDTQVELVFYISKLSNNLVKLDIETDTYYYDDLSFSLVLGKDPFNSKELSLTINENDYSHKILYYVDADSKAYYSSTFYVEMYSEDVFSAWFTRHKDNGDFTLKLSDTYDEMSFDGLITQDRGNTTIAVNELSFNGDALPCSITARIKEKDAMPSMPYYTDILTVSEGQMDVIADELTDKLYDFEYEYEDLIYFLDDLFYYGLDYEPAPAEYPAVEPTW